MTSVRRLWVQVPAEEFQVSPEARHYGLEFIQSGGGWQGTATTSDEPHTHPDSCAAGWVRGGTVMGPASVGHTHVHTDMHARTHTRYAHTHAHLSFPKGITSFPAQGALCCLRQRTTFTIFHAPAGCPPHARYPPGAGASHRQGGESPRPRGGMGNRQLGKERNQTKAGETCVSSPKQSRERGQQPGDVSYRDPTPTSP